MEYEDRLKIATPEGVDLELALAGIGSRLIASLIDGLLEATLLVALLFAVSGILGTTGLALFIPCLLIVPIGYNVLFEVLGSGRTPAKRWTSLRVIGANGGPVGLRASAVRNILRFVDGPMTLYIAGFLSVLASKRNQRLGDMAADTLVVREPRPVRPAQPSEPPAEPDGWAPPAISDSATAWDVTGITADELAAVSSFLERRAALESSVRGALAAQLDERLRAKVAGVPDELRGELFLERLWATKAGAR